MHIWLITNNYGPEKAFIGSEQGAKELMDTLRDAHYAQRVRVEGLMDFSYYCALNTWRIRSVEAYSG